MVDREVILQNEIIRYKKAYYDGDPLITDAAYDLLEDELRKINPDNPALHLVGTPSGGKVSHDPPMLSCKKATNLEEVVKWFEDSEGSDLYFGYKIDGLSLSVMYDNGKLQQAATRGNGMAGDDVSFAVFYIDDIPKTLPVSHRVNVRGEVYMNISEFNRLKETMPELSSPRNFASGTMKQKDPSILKERKLSFMAWGLVGHDDDISLAESNEILRNWGFNTADIKLLHDVDGEVIKNSFEEVDKRRADLDFELDGVMYKYNEAADRKRAGTTEHHPKWQIALKFKNQGAITTVKKIIWQVGRTGVLTPVAEVKSVKVAGASITRATLHNAEFVETLNLAIGDKVYLERSGDVIPKIIEVVEKGDNEMELITSCPSCDTKLVRESVNLVCNGPKCKARDLRSIEHWIKTTEIKGIGDKSLEKLFDKGIITHFSDLYSQELTEEILVGELGANGKKIYKSIDSTRRLPFNVFLASLGVTQLGKKLGKELAKKFPDLNSLQTATADELIQIEGISDLTANYVIDGVNDPNLTDRILMHDFEIVYQKITDKAKGESRGKVYVTGRVDGFNKKELEEKVVSMGFEWSKSISKKLNYLVVGSNPGGSKIDKALVNDVPILTWNEFLKQFE